MCLTVSSTPGVEGGGEVGRAWGGRRGSMREGGGAPLRGDTHPTTEQLLSMRESLLIKLWKPDQIPVVCG